MEARRGQFHNASCREDGSSIVLRAHRAVGETFPPCCVHTEQRSSPPGDVFFPFPPPLSRRPPRLLRALRLSFPPPLRALLLSSPRSRPLTA